MAEGIVAACSGESGPRAEMADSRLLALLSTIQILSFVAALAFRSLSASWRSAILRWPTWKMRLPGLRPMRSASEPG